MREDNQKFDILVLGNGICAQSILFEIGKSAKFDLDTLRIGQVFNEDLAPSCTSNTTSVVSLSGTTKGLSPLGDLIVDSFHYTKDLADKNFKGHFYSGKQFYIYDKLTREEEFLRRFNSITEQSFLGHSFMGAEKECFILDSGNLLSQISFENKAFITEMINDTIVNISKERVVSLLSGKKISAKIIVSALGAYSNHFIKGFDCEHLDKSKTVPGDYLIFDNVDLGEESFVLTRKHYNLVYRHFSKTVLIGGTTLKTDCLSVDYVELRPLYDYFKSFIGKLPPFEEGTIKTGLRHKGQRRLPFLDEISDSIYSFHGVYKNGFTFSFFMAKDFVGKLSKLV